MDQAWAALGGAFLGAASAIGSGLALETYKRRRDRQGVALAIAGEVFSILHITEKRQLVNMYAAALKKLEAGEDVKLPGFKREPPNVDPVLEKHLDRIGFLGGNLPYQIAAFYSQLQGIRTDLMDLGSGRLDGRPSDKASLLRHDLALWSETVQIGRKLVADLQRVGNPTSIAGRIGRAWEVLLGRAA